MEEWEHCLDVPCKPASFTGLCNANQWLDSSIQAQIINTSNSYETQEATSFITTGN